MILKNGNVLIDNRIIKTDILIKDGKISKIAESINGDNILDCTNLFISPGFLDVHVHLREPGFTRKETISSGTKASAKGGYTHIFSMPNVDPVPYDCRSLKVQQDIIDKDAVIKVTPYGSISKDLSGQTLSNMDELSNVVCAFTDDGLGVQSDVLMEQAMVKSRELDKIIVAHCEDNRFIDSDNERAEYEQVKRDIDLVRKTNAKYHICHISTKESIEYVREAKKEGLNVTCEITPHHLMLSKDMVNNNPDFKMNPPLRSVEDVAACIEGFLDGTIDIVATDHAPHTEEEKSVKFEDAPNGVVGIETSFGILYKHYVTSGYMTLEELIIKMSTKPHQIFDIKGGIIKEGYDADLTIIDLDEEYKINKEEFLSLSRNTPFNNEFAQGVIKYTLVEGNIIYR